MKRIVILLLTFISLTTVFAASAKFNLDIDKILKGKDKTTSLASQFNSDYTVEASKETVKDEAIIRDLTKEVTYLLLGPTNNVDESAENYLKRKEAFFSYRYSLEIPRDENGELDRESDEYKIDVFTGMVLPSMFVAFDQREIVYTEFGSIRVAEGDNEMYSLINIPNAKIKTPNREKPMEFQTITANISITYIFRELNGEYKLYYVYGEVDPVSFDEYMDEQISHEYKGTVSSKVDYNKAFEGVYDFSKLKAVTSNDVRKVYNDNQSNVLIFTALYDKAVRHTATGFFISDGIAVTTWNFLEKSLSDGQVINVVDGKGNVLKLEGIVSIDPENDIAVLKVSGSPSNGVKIGEYANVKREDPVIVISTKVGLALTTQTGIVTSSTNNLSTLMPISLSEDGSPIFNTNGEVIGMNTVIEDHPNMARGINSNPLVELQKIFKAKNIENVVSTPFIELKNNYYVQYSEINVVNTLGSKDWSKYKKIGNLENNISLDLVKASSKNGVVSLRYKNDLNPLLTNMYFANPFIKELLNNGYKEVSNNEYKKVYKNNKYRVTIMSEFNFLIIAIAEV